MDLISHAFWTTALAVLLKRKTKASLKISSTAFWGMFPDLFAFIFPILLFIFGAIVGRISFSDLGRAGEIGLLSPFASEIFQLISLLYKISHSLIIFSATVVVLSAFIFLNRRFGLSLKFQKFPLEVSAWAFHILLDIPTHAIGFFATPFLFPISDWTFNGISWRTPWFLALDYLLMIIVYFFCFRKKGEAFKKRGLKKI